jgi:hypothetical protein
MAFLASHSCTVVTMAADDISKAINENLNPI